MIIANEPFSFYDDQTGLKFVFVKYFYVANDIPIPSTQKMRQQLESIGLEEDRNFFSMLLQGTSQLGISFKKQELFMLEEEILKLIQDWQAKGN